MQIPAIKTWYDRRHGVVILDDDTLGIVKRIKAIDDRLMVFWNDQVAMFDIVERCLDGTDRLVSSVPQLDERIINRLLLADHWGGNSTPEGYITPDSSDYLSKIDRDNEALETAQQAKHGEAVREVGERLAHALDLPLKGNVSRSVFISSERSPFAQDESRRDQDRARE
jgi:hypothetical protein